MAMVYMVEHMADNYPDQLSAILAKDAEDDGERMISFHTVASVITPIVIGILLAVGLMGNIAVVFVTFRTHRVIKHPVHSMLVLNLAASDLAYLVSSAPYEAITYSLPQWIFGSFLCRAFHFVNAQTMSVSIFTMCSLATLRYLGIARPFQFKASYVTRSERHAGVVIIVAVWVFGSVLAAPNILFYKMLSPKHSSNSTELVCVWPDREKKFFYEIAVMTFTFFLPLLLVTFLYFLISREILCYMKSNSTMLQAEKTEYVRSTIMVFILALAFFVCWLPFHLYTIIKMTERYNEPEYFYVTMILNVAGQSFSYAHACVNPIIYTFAAPGFRRGLSRSSSRNSRRPLPNNSANKMQARSSPEEQPLHTTMQTEVYSEHNHMVEQSRLKKVKRSFKPPLNRNLTVQTDFNSS